MVKKDSKGKFNIQLKLVKKPKKQLEKLPFRRFVFAAAALNLFIILVVIALQGLFPPEVPLYYGLARSEAQLTTSLGLIIPSVAAIVLLILNILLTLTVGSVFLKKILVASALSITLLTTITTIKIIFLVISY